MRGLVLGVLACGLFACSGNGLDSYDTNSAGPDPFEVSTNKPLEQPDDLSNLPKPGGTTNRADVDPVADATAVLGGTEKTSGMPPASDAALIRQAERFGTRDDIRGTLAAEDEKFRKNRGRLHVLRRKDKYYAAYSSMALDAYSENEKFRKRGVTTPTAPPR